MIELKNILSEQISAFNKTAEKIEKTGIKDIEKNIVHLTEEKISIKSNVEILQTNNELLGTIINLKV